MDSLFFSSSTAAPPIHLTYRIYLPYPFYSTMTMTMTTRFSPLLMALLCVLVCQQQVEAFAGVHHHHHHHHVQPFVNTAVRSPSPVRKHTNTLSSSTTAASSTTSSTSLNAVSLDSDMLLSATTLDPTTFFQNFLSLFLNTPIILAVPIVAALGVAGTLVFFIVSYASPAEDN
jgi:hypothetical protein